MAKRTTRDERFVTAFMTVWSIHKSGEPAKMILTAYKKALSEYDIEDIESAFAYALNELQWFPKPVELRNFIQHGPGNLEDIAYAEADNVVNAVREIGIYESVTFDDPVTMAVIAKAWAGWMKLCETLRDDEVKWFRKDFVRIYKAYSNQDIKFYGHLIGFHEDHNIQNYKDHVTPPKLIGDPKKAQKVLEYKSKRKFKVIEHKK